MGEIPGNKRCSFLNLNRVRMDQMLIQTCCTNGICSFHVVFYQQNFGTLGSGFWVLGSGFMRFLTSFELFEEFD